MNYSIFGSVLTALFFVFSFVGTTSFVTAAPSTTISVKCKCGDACPGASCTKCDCSSKTKMKNAKANNEMVKACKCGDTCPGASCTKCDCGSKIKSAKKTTMKVSANANCECKSCNDAKCSDCSSCECCSHS